MVRDFGRVLQFNNPPLLLIHHRHTADEDIFNEQVSLIEFSRSSSESEIDGTRQQTKVLSWCDAHNYHHRGCVTMVTVKELEKIVANGRSFSFYVCLLYERA